jgi:hypothetical protein
MSMCGGVVGILFSSRQLVLGGPRACHRLASQAGAPGQLLISTKEMRLVGAMCGSQRKLILTDSGLSVGFTR